MKKTVGLNINLDSIRECLKLAGQDTPPAGFKDPAFHAITDRFLALADEFGAKLTFFVIGRDLADPASRAQVQRWAALGHEIANHTHTHPQNLADLPLAKIRAEIEVAHAAIAEAVGTPPRGFLAPMWSYGPEVASVVREMDYEYDCSLAPSWLMIPAYWRVRALSRGHPDLFPLWRRDLPGALAGSRQPYLVAESSPWRGEPPGVSRKTVMLPMPLAFCRFPVWHTLRLILPGWFFRMALRSAFRRSRAFYYIMHPADLLDPATDLEGLPHSLRRLERMAVPLAAKLRTLRATLEWLAPRAELTTMRELALRQMR